MVVFSLNLLGAKALAKTSSDQYALVLTKLRIFQLDKKGLRKIVMMDAWLSIETWCRAPQPSICPEPPKFSGRHEAIAFYFLVRASLHGSQDADTLVLQNIDELFWLPSPSVTVDKDWVG